MIEEDIISQKKILVSKVAPSRLQAAKSSHRSSVLAVAGVALMACAVLVTSGDVAVILVSIGATMAVAGLLGVYWYDRVLDSLLLAEDILEVSKRKDPSLGPKVKLMVPKDDTNTTILLGPSNLTVAQWKLIYERSKVLHGKWAREGVWVASGANVTNVNRVYKLTTDWALENQLLENRSGNSSKPDYYLLPKGHWAMEEVTSGKSPRLRDVNNGDV